ncbi:PAC2 family protein [Aquipuribacter nitratireducens]|uniref:PAC2 family protein n=1 Tax=Aquipuribacter nitratireducens TaxID=650104 RepID=A0ABW0GJK4_9MICO
MPDVDPAVGGGGPGGPEESPLLVAAFRGWNDAADSASDAVSHLVEAWGAEVVAELDPEPYYDFQVNRPEAVVLEDGSRGLEWPGTRVLRARVRERTVLLVDGTEPSTRWRSFARELLDVARGHGVQRLVTLAALLTDVPHTRPIPVSATVQDPALAEAWGLDVSTYEGPTGIVGVLQHEAAASGLPGVSLWAAVPHYVAQPPNPKSTLALLGRLEDLTGLSSPVSELREEADAWQRGVDELAQEDEEIAEYVAQLEEARDTADLPEASGEAIAREFERYLRRRDR